VTDYDRQCQAWVFHRYRRKANVSVDALAYVTPYGTVLEVRPSIGAVGPFRLKIKEGEDGAQITVTSVVATANGGTVDVGTPETRRAFRNQFVSQGETVSSSTLFRPDTAIDALIGWFVTFDVTGRGLLRDGLSWQARVFVPVTDPRRWASSIPAPPPFRPDLDLIGYIEEGQKSP
jgi:hypothetical protein